jgi:hypothetical protein
MEIRVMRSSSNHYFSLYEEAAYEVTGFDAEGHTRSSLPFPDSWDGEAARVLPKKQGKLLGAAEAYPWAGLCQQFTVRSSLYGPLLAPARIAKGLAPCKGNQDFFGT